MKELKKIRLSDLGSEKKMNPEKLAQLMGGSDVGLFDGCRSKVCLTERSTAEELCRGSAWCTSGVGG